MKNKEYLFGEFGRGYLASNNKIGIGDKAFCTTMFTMKCISS